MSYQPPKGVRTKPPKGERTIHVQVQCFPELLGTWQPLTVSGERASGTYTKGAQMLKKDKKFKLITDHKRLKNEHKWFMHLLYDIGMFQMFL